MEAVSLYEKFGGEGAVANVVEKFYERILADDMVNSFFTNTNMERLRAHQTKFISFALGGPNAYTGRAMAKAHEGLNLQPVHFQAIAGHLADTLASFGVGDEDIRSVLNKISSLKDDILYK